MLSEVEQQEQQRSDWSSGREWESQRKTLRALDGEAQDSSLDEPYG